MLKPVVLTFVVSVAFVSATDIFGNCARIAARTVASWLSKPRCNPSRSSRRDSKSEISLRSSGGSRRTGKVRPARSEEHTSELQSRFDLVCRLLLEKQKYPPPRRP